jgi:GDP-mannose 6-dehydrogenase
MAAAELVLLCVGTPSGPDGALQLEHVKRAAHEVGEALRLSGTFTTVVMRSTMLPGSVEAQIVPALEAASGKRARVDFGVAYNPEFLREGSAVADFFGAEITVVGASDERSAAAVRTLYDGVGGELVVTSIRTAEMLKYVNNAYHALKVSFANEVGRWARIEGVDSHEVMALFCRDTRLNLGASYLKPGFAFGGSCLPKDLRALNQRARHHDLELPVLASIMRSNDRHVEEAIQLIERLKKRRIGVLGLSFKAETDDLRESPILRVVGALVGKGYGVLLHDPNIDMERVLGANRRFVEDEVPYLPERLRATVEEVVKGSEVIVVANGAKEFRGVGAMLKPGQALVDLVHAVDRASVIAGEYHGLAW